MIGKPAASPRAHSCTYIDEVGPLYIVGARISSSRTGRHEGATMDGAIRGLGDVLLGRAEQRPDVVGYEYLDEGDRLETLTYGQLTGRAANLAVQLAGTGPGPALVL